MTLLLVLGLSAVLWAYLGFANFQAARIVDQRHQLSRHVDRAGPNGKKF